MAFYALLVFVAAALLEVGGDAFIRKGLSGPRLLIVVGLLMLGGYGLLVNKAQPVDFSKLLGSYVAVFAVVSVLCGKFFFEEWIPLSTWIGLVLIVIGGMVIQWGGPG